MRIVFWLGIAAMAVSGVMGGEVGSTTDEWSAGEDEESSFEEAASSSWSFRKRVDTEASVLWADGVTLSEYSLGTRLTSDPFDLGFLISRNEYEVTYEPEIFGSDASLSEDRTGYTVDGRLSIGEDWSLLGSASYYDGFTDYRSLWISEYYEQLFGEVDGYIEPSPKGYSVSVGLEWEYLPVMGRLRFTGGYGRDTIAPAYDFGANGLERSRPNLYTKTLQLQTENVLSANVVVQNTVQYTDTTNREKRWSTQTAWNVALAERWFLRTQAGFAVEQPEFDAYFAGGSLEYEFVDDWFVRISARYYEDTGEIENSLGGFTSSAPALESFELGAGIRWEGIHSALNLYVGYYQTEYEPLAEDNAFLKNLYNDRRWGLVQLSYTYTF